MHSVVGRSVWRPTSHVAELVSVCVCLQTKEEMQTCKQQATPRSEHVSEWHYVGKQKGQTHSWFPPQWLHYKKKSSETNTPSKTWWIYWHTDMTEWTFYWRSLDMHTHFFVIGTSSLVTGNISISFLILSAITLLFAESILRDIKSNGPPEVSNKTFVQTLKLKPAVPLHQLIHSFIQ